MRLERGETSRRRFNQFILPCRPAGSAWRFEEFRASLTANVEAHTERSRTLATLRDTLLPKLLSGELSVSN